MFDPTKVQWPGDMAQSAQAEIDRLTQAGAFDMSQQANVAAMPALSSRFLNFGATPMDGMDYVTHYGGGPPQVPEGAKGYYVMTGSTPGQAGTGNEGSQTYRFVGEQQAAPVARQPVQEEPVPQAPSDGKTIYNDWDTYQNKARAEVEGMNRMPFVRSNFDLVSLDPQKAMNQFYPAAWQEEGVQKTIGPNGANIAPRLQKDFETAQLVDTTKADWPSLVAMLAGNGQIDQRQQQALLDLAKPKKANTGMGGMGMYGMMMG